MLNVNKARTWADAFPSASKLFKNLSLCTNVLVITLHYNPFILSFFACHVSEANFTEKSVRIIYVQVFGFELYKITANGVIQRGILDF